MQGKLNRQKGMVLVISLLYLMIITMAALALFESAGILAYSTSNVTRAAKQFYLLESELLTVEKIMLNNYFTESDLEELFYDLKVRYVEDQYIYNMTTVYGRWKELSDETNKYRQAESLVEFLGYRESNELQKQIMLRVSVRMTDEELPIMLQSLLLIPLQEDSSYITSGRRIARFELMLTE
jgi:hypothetical protein